MYLPFLGSLEKGRHKGFFHKGPTSIPYISFACLSSSCGSCHLFINKRGYAPVRFTLTWSERKSRCFFFGKTVTHSGSCVSLSRSYGSVHKAIHKRTGMVAAIKRIPIEDDNMEQSIKEISMMTGCDSGYIIHFFGSFMKENCLWVRHICRASSHMNPPRLSSSVSHPFSIF